MALSFSDSIKKAKTNSEIQTMSLYSEVPESSQPVMQANATISEDETWTRNDKYLWYDDYADDKVSVIDVQKNIVVNQDQINLTQESNSQFIPFVMNRYYDGFDLVSTNILIHFVNKNGNEDFATPVNVSYCQDKIRFSWLVDKRATAIAGDLTFEIHAVGTNSKGDEYIWKTKPNGKLNILKSLEGNGVIEPDSTWLTSFLTQINEKVALAQQAAQDAQAAVSSAQDAVTQANQAAQEAQNTVDNAKAELQASLNTSITSALSNYYTKEEVDNLLKDIDLTDVYDKIDNIDGLANFNTSYDPDTRVLTFYNGETVIKSETLNSNPTAEWVTAYDSKMDTKISTAVSAVQSDLDTYKEAVNADLESIHNDIDGLPQTLATDYYNKEATDSLLENKADKSVVNALSTKVSSVESTANTNKSNITVLGGKISDLESLFSNIDTSPQCTYDITYDEEQILTLWEIENEGTAEEVRTAKAQYKILGGGGGGGTSSVLKIEYITRSPLTVTTNDKAIIKFNFSGTDSSGDIVTEGQATWKVGNTVVATSTVIAGENSFDATDYISIGTQKILLSVTDDAGSLVTKSWTVQKVDVRLESTFNDKLTYPIEEISFDYTPYGAISKDIHFILDGTELSSVTTASSGIPMAYTLPSQSHGAHLLEVYMTAEINGSVIESNHIVKDIIWYDSSNENPVISCVQQNIVVKQYDTTNIVYSVYDPKTESPTVTLSVDGNVVSTLNLDSNTQTWQYKSSDVGEHTLTIACRDTVKTLHVTVEKLDINIEPVTAGLAFDFNPSGKSNNDTDRLWSDGEIVMSVSDNFDWTNGGYQIDENGDQYFCIKAGTSATINYKLFEDDAKRNGKEMKLVFKTTNVQQADAQFLSCVDNTTGSNHIGIEMFVHEAFIYGSADKINLPYAEDEIIEFEFNISKNTEDVPEICGYEDGVSTRHLVYDNSFNFTQSTPQNIALGSDKCDLHIYRMKVYNTSLNSRGILNNFIADARNAEEMVDRYNRNQIYNENQELTPEILAEMCPWLHVYKLSAPYFTNNKSDKVPYTTIQQIYKDGDPILDNWTCYDASHAGQGTSSNNYGAAGRNLDFIMNKSQRDGVKPYFILGDGVTRVKEITMTRDSVPVAYLNAKVNIASSNNFTNALLAMRYNQYNPVTRPFVRDDESLIPKIKDTMQFQNCVIFVQETDTTMDSNGNYVKHREFNDCSYHFYAAGNIGDSKKNDKTRLTDPDDKYECIVEIMDVDLPLSEWPVDTMINAMGSSTDTNTGEVTYTWAKDENLGILYELIDGKYVLTTDATVDLTKTYYVDILEQEDFSEDYTYGWRYIWDDGTDEENAEVFNRCKAAWINLYRFVTTSSDEDFKAHFNEYFIEDSALYYYLFTERYCMTDSRCKNTFWHLGKTGTYRALSKPVKELLHLYCESTDSGYIPTTDTEIDPLKTYYTQYAFDLCFDYDNDKNC